MCMQNWRRRCRDWRGWIRYVSSSYLVAPCRVCFRLVARASTCVVLRACVIHRARTVPQIRWPPLQNHLLTPITALPSRMAVQSDVYWNHARKVARSDGGWCARGGVKGARNVLFVCSRYLLLFCPTHGCITLGLARESKRPFLIVARAACSEAEGYLPRDLPEVIQLQDSLFGHQSM